MLQLRKRIPTRSRTRSNLQIKRGYPAAAVSRALRVAAGIFPSQRGEALNFAPYQPISFYAGICFFGNIKFIPTPPTISTRNANTLPSGPTVPPVSQVGP
jgi:hypothetical protein